MSPVIFVENGVISIESVGLKQRFPTWGACTPKGTFRVSDRRSIYIYISLLPNIYTYISEYYFQNPLYAYCWIYQWLTMLNILSLDILGVHLHQSKCWKGTCLYFQMLKGYMLICRNAAGVHGQRKVGNPCSKGSSNDVASAAVTAPVPFVHRPSLILLHRVWDLPSYLGRWMTRLCRSSLTLARLKTSLTLMFAIDWTYVGMETGPQSEWLRQKFLLKP